MARRIHNHQVELCQGMALVRCFTIPLSRLRIILRRSLTGKFHSHAELGLRIAVASPGFSGFGSFCSGLLRAAEQSAKERCGHTPHTSRPEPKHKLIPLSIAGPELTQDKCYRGGELDEASGNTLTQVRGYRNNEHESVR